MFRIFTRCFSKLGPTDLKGRKSAAQKWLLRQWNDPYVKRAKLDSYRCRSAYKLLEIDDKYDILRPGYVVIDCGASPGSWSQVAVNRVNATGAAPDKPRGKVISIDLQGMEPVPGSTVLANCDITAAATWHTIMQELDGKQVDVVLSDMAPSASGVSSLDHDNIVLLAMVVLRKTLSILKEANREGDKNGTLLMKLWQGSETDKVVTAMSKCFSDVRIVKPLASRANSAEIYVLARGFSLSIGGKLSSD